MAVSINYRGQNFTFSQLLRSMVLAAPVIWLVAFVIILAAEFPQFPRQALTYITPKIDGAQVPVRVSVVVTNRNKGTTISYDVTYTFTPPDGIERRHTQRILAHSRPVGAWPTAVHYSTRYPELSTLEPEWLVQFLSLRVMGAFAFPVAILGCGLLFWCPWFLILWLRERRAARVRTGSLSEPA